MWKICGKLHYKEFVENVLFYQYNVETFHKFYGKQDSTIDWRHEFHKFCGNLNFIEFCGKCTFH